MTARSLCLKGQWMMQARHRHFQCSTVLLARSRARKGQRDTVQLLSVLARKESVLERALRESKEFDEKRAAVRAARVAKFRPS
mmetsp:Transcript_87155/g.279433  ORF Transcript_87155/g.279433 Transcript_87155/m.279433 type:complete len:83 (+) Transcript_87155:666-914(+)